MSLHPLTPEDTRLRVARGTQLIDVRERDEHARERIAGAHCAPLSALPDKIDAQGEDVIFHCKAGSRTAANAERLIAAAGGKAYVLEGGIEAWKKAGLPVERDAKAPLEIMRQVQITAGSLVVLGVVLGAVAAPGFYLLSAFVGAGLVFAGATGWCGMAKLLGAMPWNRRAAA